MRQSEKNSHLFLKERNIRTVKFTLYQTRFFLVRPLMYGFGDDINPRQDTVELVEDLMIEYIETIVLRMVLILINPFVPL